MININSATVTAQLISSLNHLLSNFLSSVYATISSILDDLAFIDQSITSDLSPIVGDNLGSGILLICNSLIYGFLIYYAISYLFSHLTFTQVEHPAQFIFKLLLCSLAINGSLIFCSFLIHIISLISNSVLMLGESLFHTKISFICLIDALNPQNYFLEGLFNIFSFDGLLKSLISISFITLTISYSIRYVIIKVFILISPFAIVSLINAKSSWFFKSWLKNFLSMLFLQVLISFILVVYFAITFNDNTIINQLIQFGIIFTLVKANSFLKEFMGGLSAEINFSSVSMFNMFKGGNIK